MGYDDTPAEHFSYKHTLLETLDRIGCGGLVLDRHRNLLAANSVAIELIRRRVDLPHLEAADLAKAIGQFVNSVPLSSTAEDLARSRQHSEHQLAILRVPAGEDIVLVLVDLGTRLSSDPSIQHR